MAKDKDYRQLIHTTAWIRLRRWKLTHNPLCERCAQDGIVTAATEVHHVTPVECGLSRMEKQALMFNPTNLQSLCHDCHVRTHTEMGRAGKAYAKNRAAERLKRFAKRFTATPADGSQEEA